MKRWIAFSIVISLLFLEGCTVYKITQKKAYKNEIVHAELNYDYQQLKEDLFKLQESYPGKLQVDTIGTSIEGRELYVARMGTGPKKLVVIGGVHAREWMTTYLLMSLIELYLKHDQEGKKLKGYPVRQLLETVSVSFIPMVNPDGVDLVLNGIGDRDRKLLIRMNEGEENFSRWKANIAGVDLNRQFPADWEATDSKEAPSFENYKGMRPLDQPESEAIARFTLGEQPEMTIAYHLSGSVIFWYYNQKDEHYKRDLKIGKKVGRITGYKLIEEEDSDDIAAGYKDWFVKVFERSGYTIEIGEQRYDQIDVDAIDRFIGENQAVIPYLMKVISKAKK
ncbi:g-D-glutamyl-meso-diaminopimelate peptidase [Anaerosolibacter carboniphilus]|uniref:G-D-glutamyl-meso-diaminopimelate peptidase n=1 Tax=Anaerosolibacter carboniphilus TaxID=1417629 RepID=A0A841KYX2_9FIRM|nr:M14 family zinc carboxypeptidase [Anaerosolibacter carboniphilus]MBB6218681.1 g-D-glutamyl-meso-diaminopimelate peptidase [Anaerosolibacter carboniphilus]